MKTVLLVVVLAAAAAAVCVYFFVLREPGEAPPQTPQPFVRGQQKPKELTDAQKRKLADKKYTELRKYARRYQDDLVGIESRVKEIETLAGSGSAITIKARRVLKTAHREYKEGARRTYRDLAGKVEEAFEEKRNKPGTPDTKKDSYELLFKQFDKFPPKFLTPEYSEKLFKLKEPIKKAIEACEAYEEVRFAATTAARQNKFKDAVEALDKFPERFRKSEWEAKRQELLTKYKARLGEQETEKKKEESLTYYDLYHGQPLDKSDWSGEQGSWKIVDGVLIGEDAAGTEAVLAYSGGSDWADLVLRLRMRLVRGSITIAVRGTEKREGFLTYDPIRLSVGDLQANRWYTLCVRLRGDKYTVTAAPPLPYSQESYAEKKRGPVAIWVKSNSEIHIKSIKVAFFDKIPASFANEATKQQSDGRAKKLGESQDDD